MEIEQVRAGVATHPRLVARREGKAAPKLGRGIWGPSLLMGCLSAVMLLCLIEPRARGVVLALALAGALLAVLTLLPGVVLALLLRVATGRRRPRLVKGSPAISPSILAEDGYPRRPWEIRLAAGRSRRRRHSPGGSALL